MRSFRRSPTFYVVYHSVLFAPFSDLDDHTLQECDLDRSMMRSETMAERAPLLPRAYQSSRDYPIFVRVCHSPWNFLNQKGLLLVRGVLAVYLTVVLVLSILHDCDVSPNEPMFIFDARTISFSIQPIYYWITAVRLRSAGCLFYAC